MTVIPMIAMWHASRSAAAVVLPPVTAAAPQAAPLGVDEWIEVYEESGDDEGGEADGLNDSYLDAVNRSDMEAGYINVGGYGPGGEVINSSIADYDDYVEPTTYQQNANTPLGWGRTFNGSYTEPSQSTGMPPEAGWGSTFGGMYTQPQATPPRTPTRGGWGKTFGGSYTQPQPPLQPDLSTTDDWGTTFDGVFTQPQSSPMRPQKKKAGWGSTFGGSYSQPQTPKRSQTMVGPSITTPWGSTFGSGGGGPGRPSESSNPQTWASTFDGEYVVTTPGRANTASPGPRQPTGTPPQFPIRSAPQSPLPPAPRSPQSPLPPAPQTSLTRPPQVSPARPPQPPTSSPARKAWSLTNPSYRGWQP